MKYIIKILLTFSLTALLLYFGFDYILDEGKKNMLFQISFKNHLLSIALMLPITIIGGLELKLLYKKISRISLSIYDVLTLPIVTNLWSFIIPFQGSLLYTITYIRLKYSKKISESIRVYVLSFLITTAIAGLIGILFCFFSRKFQTLPLLLVSTSLFLAPFILSFLSYISNKYKINTNKNRFVSFIIKSIELSSFRKSDTSLILYLVGTNALNILFTLIWSYWISTILELKFTLFQLLLLSFLQKVVSILKVTPGNLGFSQLAAGGIAILVGGTLRDGFLLSAFQYLTLILVVFTSGVLFSLLNTKYFNWSELKTIFRKQH